MSSSQLKVTAFIGLFFIGVYLVLTTGLISAPEHLAATLAFFIGPAAILGVLNIWRVMRSDERMSESLELPLLTGTVFLVIGFALFNLMLVVQQTIRSYYFEMRDEATSAAARETLRTIYRVVNPVQLGIDVSFDIFYGLGVILLAWVMLRSRIFGRLLGVYGVVVTAAMLGLNLWTFPKPPASVGSIDLGPATALWWIVVIVQMLRANRARAAMPAAA